MDVNKQLSPDLTLNFVEYTNTLWLPKEECSVVSCVRMHFSFYNCSYSVLVDLYDVQQDLPPLQIEGDSVLFDSFQNLITDQYWPQLKETFKIYSEWYDEHLGEGKRKKEVEP